MCEVLTPRLLTLFNRGLSNSKTKERKAFVGKEFSAQGLQILPGRGKLYQVRVANTLRNQLLLRKIPARQTIYSATISTAGLRCSKKPVLLASLGGS